MNREFTDGKILIRPYRTDDVPLLLEAVRESIPDISRWLAWCHSNYSIQDSTMFVSSRQSEWEKGEAYSFAVFDIATSRFVGGVGLNFFNRLHQFANLGYWIRSTATKQGYATAATLLAARFAFDELLLKRVEIVVPVGNQASERVAEKAGATREGILRNRLFLHGRPRNAHMFSLIAGDLIR